MGANRYKRMTASCNPTCKYVIRDTITWIGGGMVGDESDVGAKLKTMGMEPDQFAERREEMVALLFAVDEEEYAVMLLL